MSSTVDALILLANLAILGLNLKLYTEYFKDRSQIKRGRADGAP